MDKLRARAASRGHASPVQRPKFLGLGVAKKPPVWYPIGDHG
jgi:hypothetical protein